MNEAVIIINGQTLTDAQSMTIRCALNTYQSTIADEGLGDDEHGKRMSEAYLERTSEVLAIIHDIPTEPRKHVQTSGGICPHCGGFTTYTRQNDGRGCMKCEGERKTSRS